MQSKHHEIHVLLSPEDADLYVQAGLPELGPDTESCSNCGTDIGCTPTRFIGLALSLNENGHHFLCLSCAAPVLHPKA